MTGHVIRSPHSVKTDGQVNAFDQRTRVNQVGIQ